MLSDKQLAQSFATVAIPMAILDREFRIISINNAMAEMLNSTPDNLLGRYCYESFTGCINDSISGCVSDSYPPSACPYNNILIDRSTFTREIYNKKLDKYYFITVAPIYDHEGKINGSVLISQDITERKLETDVQSLQLKMIDYAANHSAEELLLMFVDEAEIRTKSNIGFYHLIEKDQKTVTLQTWSSKTLKGGCNITDSRIHYPIAEAGVWVDCVYSGEPVIYNDYDMLAHKKGLPAGHVPIKRILVVPVVRDGKIAAILGVGNKEADYGSDDVELVQQLANLCLETVERKLVEEALQASEAKYRSMMEAMNDAAYICSSDFRIKYTNPAMQERLGRDAIGENCYKALNNLDDKCPWCCHEKIMNGDTLAIEVVSPLDKKVYHISNSPIIHQDGSVSKLAIYRDITDYRKLERQLQQAQKMEAIGTLAGGIAHDFNNILCIIKGYNDLTMSSLSNENGVQENLVKISDACARAEDLIRQILTICRMEKVELVPHLFGIILKECTKLLRSTIPASIEIETDIENEYTHVMADKSQLYQIIMNLLTNAYQALPEYCGKISIGLKKVLIEPGHELCPQGLLPGSYMRLTVRDNGIGIAPEIKGRIFEPYFTTKPLGEGTGLGLSVVHGIVKRLNGFITIDSATGSGSSFQVYLHTYQKRINLNNFPNQKELPRGTEHILLVDDEVSIVGAYSKHLMNLGYKVTECTASLDAIKIFKADPDKFSLIITDMNMPHITGRMLARELLKIKPNIPIILMSGYSQTINEDSAKRFGFKDYISKPFSITNVAFIIRRIIDEAVKKDMNSRQMKTGTAQ